MMRIRIASCLLLFLFCLCSVSRAGEGSVYKKVIEELDKYPNRLPGSEGFNHSLETVDNILKNAGLKTHRQTYDTLVPKTGVCVFKIGGKVIEGVYPLAPNGAVPVSTGDDVLSGKLVYVGDGGEDSLNGKSVEGNIAVLEFSSRNLDRMFSNGAKAVVLVGDDHSTQWQAASHFSPLPFSAPKVYVDRKTALAAGMLKNDGAEASLKINVKWERVRGINLWTEIPGEEGARFDLGKVEETIVLSAPLSTFGTVPDLCPDNRKAANVALLAEVAVKLASEKPKRSVLVTFFGSHYSSQDGARNFFYALGKAYYDSQNKDPLPVRKTFYEAEIAELAAYLDLLGKPGFLASDDKNLNNIKTMLRKSLTAKVNELNFELREIAIQNMRKGQLEPDRQIMLVEFEKRHHKRIWNDMKRQIKDRAIDDPAPLFVEGDIFNSGELCINLSRATAKDCDPLTLRLWNALSPEAQAIVKDGLTRAKKENGEPNSKALTIAQCNRFIEFLNLLVSNPDFSQPDDDLTGLRYDVSDMMERRGRLSENETMFLNRLLIEKVCGMGVKGCILFKKHFAELIADLKSELQKKRIEVEQLLENNRTSQELADIITVNQGDDNTKRLVKNIILHLDFDFASDEAPWLLSVRGDPAACENSAAKIGDYSRNLNAIKDIYLSLSGREKWKAPLLEGALSGVYTPFFLCTPRPRVLSCIVSQSIGINGYHMVTAGDSLNSDELPLKSKHELIGLAGMLTPFISKLAESSELSMRGPPAKKAFKTTLLMERSSGQLRGFKFDFTAKGGSEIEGPAWGAVAIVENSGKNRMVPVQVGYSRTALGYVYGNGYLFMPLVHAFGDYNIYAANFAENGRLDRITGEGTSAKRLFYAYGGAIVRPIDSSSYDVHATPKVLNAFNDSKFMREKNFRDGKYEVFYQDYNANFKFIGNGLALLESVEKKPNGIGFASEPNKMLATVAMRQAASDYVKLNSHRLQALRERNIVNDSIEVLHADAEEHLQKAAEARKGNDITVAESHELFSSSLGLRAYEPLRDIANDMVNAVVILMIMTIPFAFALERLLFGFTTIYMQIVGFAGTFLATFATLYFAHPAFSLAEAPVMIFLAFIIILLSGLVIYIVMSKFRLEIKAMQGLVTKVHSADSESSTAMASILIGISGMRNRPLKTFLTATTIVLLTFTILVFSSFTSKIGVAETYLGRGQGADRIEIHRPSFLTVPEEFSAATLAGYGGGYNICRRNAVFPDPLFRNWSSIGSNENIAYNDKNGSTVSLKALVGIELKELEANAEMKAAFSGFSNHKKAHKYPPILLSELAQKNLGLEVGDSVKIRGAEFTFVGVFSSPLLQNYVNIDETKFIPPNYDATLNESDIQGTGSQDQIEASLESIDINSFVWSATDLTAISTYDSLARIDAIPNFVSMYPRGEQDLEKTADQIAQVFNGSVYSKTALGCKQFFFTRAFEGSGFGEIIVPLLLGGLIIFSSLLGSIVDREKEIFTYSALGLSPPDVAALFFAESSVYAIIGGLGGYLISQVIAKLMAILSSFGLFNPPEMNFSSLSSIYTILMVMATVILSTIYPALKAGKSANPGVARKWSMPEPEDDKMQFVFPFTVSASDLAGVLSFIGEHFESHSDASLGSFAAKEVRLFNVPPVEAGGAETLGIQANLSLAPFDLGIFQEFRLYSKPSDIAGIDEVIIEIKRISGAPGVWMRSNRSFIDELRSQFLLWRSLPIETVEYYRRKTSETLANYEG